MLIGQFIEAIRAAVVSDRTGKVKERVLGELGKLKHGTISDIPQDEHMAFLARIEHGTDEV